MKLRCLFWLLGWLSLAPAYAAVVPEICTVCGERLPDTAYLVPDQVAGDKKRICADCASLTQICYLCGLPVKRELTELTDGRVLCARDAKTVVLAEEEVHRICHDTKELIDRRFSRFINFPDTNITVAIADRVSLLAFFKMPGNDYECPNVMGYIQTRTNRSRVNHEISLMSGLLPGVLRATYIHECTHAWVAENLSPARKARVSRDSEEGFCELVAYLALGEMEDRTTQQLITKNNYTRGQVGLFIAAEQQFGLNEVVDWMQFGEDNRLQSGRLDRIRQTAPPENRGKATPPVTRTIPAPRPPADEELVLRGITWAGARSLAAINSHNLATGEVATIQLAGTNVTIRCLEIRPDAVIIQRSGTEIKQELRLAPVR